MSRKEEIIVRKYSSKDSEYQHYLSYLIEAIKKTITTEIWVYCLMPNHITSCDGAKKKKMDRGW